MSRLNLMLAVQSVTLAFSMGLNVWLVLQCREFAEKAVYFGDKAIEANADHRKTLDEWDASNKAVRAQIKELNGNGR
jgi:hypothetical protein